MRVFLFLLLLVAGIWASLMLGGCASPVLLEGSGIRAPAPGGYDDMCRRDPANIACGGAS